MSEPSYMRALFMLLAGACLLAGLAISYQQKQACEDGRWELAPELPLEEVERGDIEAL
jgi:hypothetical protein